MPVIRVEIEEADGKVQRAVGAEAEAVWKGMMSAIEIANLHGCPYRGPKIQDVPRGSYQEHVRTVPWPDPTPEMLEDPRFKAVWEVIKDWDVEAPRAYWGRCGATGNHVRSILDAIGAASGDPEVSEPAGRPARSEAEPASCCWRCGRKIENNCRQEANGRLTCGWCFSFVSEDSRAGPT